MRRPAPFQSILLDASLSRRRFLVRGAAVGAALGAKIVLPPGVQAATGTTDSAVIAAQKVADWDVPNGHFYTQTVADDAPADAGFVVSDSGAIRLWRDYKDLGGPAQFGFPISARYDSGGIMYQATQAAVLRWNTGADYTDVFPIFSALSELQYDDWLEARGVPRTSTALLEDPELAVETRLSWLTNPLLRRAFMEPNEATGMMRFGPPMGEPERFGPYLAQRFEKAVLQLWLDDVPGQPAAGTVSLIQTGTLLAEAGLIPEEALQPQAPPAPRPVPQTLPGTGQAPAVSVVTPGFGKYLVVSLSRQWWYAYQDGQHQYLGASGIRSLHDAGQIIGAHTCNHPSLPSLNRLAMMAELSDCKHQIESIIGVPVRYLAYPNGAVNQAVLDATAEAGYRAAFTTRSSATLRPEQPLMLPRIRYDVGEGAGAVARRIRAAPRVALSSVGSRGEQ